MRVSLHAYAVSAAICESQWSTVVVRSASIELQVAVGGVRRAAPAVWSPVEV